MFSKLKDLKKRKSVLEYNRYYLAKVVDNNDPLKLERIKFRIQGLHRNILDVNLPWTAPVKVTNQGNNSVGSISIPVLGSEIIVYFIDDYTPITLGSILRIEHQIPELINTNYPDCYGYIDKSGNKLFVNTETDEFSFTHLSGTTLNIKRNGDISVLSSGKLSLESQGNLSLKTAANCSIDCNQFKVTSTSATITGSSSLTLSSLGSTILSGASVTLGSAASIIVKAASFVVNAAFGPWLPVNGWAVPGSPSPDPGTGPAPSVPTSPAARTKPVITDFTNKTSY